MSKATLKLDLARFLADVKNSSNQSRLSISQQLDHSSEPAAAEVEYLLEDIKRNPTEYEGFRRRMQEILREEKKEINQAIEDLWDLIFELEEEKEERTRRCNVRELEWLNKDLLNAKHGISDAIQRKRESLGR